MSRNSLDKLTLEQCIYPGSRFMLFCHMRENPTPWNIYKRSVPKMKVQMLNILGLIVMHICVFSPQGLKIVMVTTRTAFKSMKHLK